MRHLSLLICVFSFLSFSNSFGQACDISKCTPEEIAKCCPPTCDITTATPEEMAKCCPWMLTDFDKDAFQTYWDNLSEAERNAFTVGCSSKRGKAEKDLKRSGFFKLNATSPRGHLGVVFRDEMPDNVISEVKLGTAAEEYKLEVGDQIVSIDGKKTANFDDIIEVMSIKKASEVIEIEIIRNNTTISKSVELRQKIDYANVDWMYRSYRKCEPDNTENPEVESRSQKVDANISSTLVLDQFSASPNPATDFIRLQFKGENKPTGISVIDISGQIIHRESISNFSGDYSKNINLERANGMVVISISQEQKVYSKQIILID